ncbi:MAG: Maf family protein [Gemmatimonadota bacterium]|jgi:septum formation protein|nr:hypothetical protein [Gemmatimonadota bacterium]MDP6461319.1 Maf family protein [Gemmatimonadota bacterium]MDP6528849.1 Maf family protein [Gemmatimonadota bacterium]MDP6802403.1 Maf family protein [Gemmatimonadota bacterium]MDP7031082.1 Maf family protein [Gemmatimonadota bacterium]
MNWFALVGAESPFRSRPLVLASSSPRRKDLLESVGIPLEIVPPEVDERSDLPEDSESLVRVLAARKARAVARTRTGGMVLGADTVVVLGGRVLGKPHDEAQAQEMLRALAGVEHRVRTGVCVEDAATGRSAECVVSTRVRFRPLTEESIVAYVASGEPFGKAGAYAIQERGRLFVEGITGDYSNVVGLPLGPSLDLIAEVLRPER